MVSRITAALGLLALAVALLLAGMTPTAEAQSRTIDYDIDDDGLIEIRTLEQLNAMHYTSTGIVSAANQAKFDAAFPRYANRGIAFPLGCASATGFCLGYELAADMDFDTNGDDRITAADGAISWNGGKGWVPVNRSLRFEGNGHTISNMMINYQTSTEAAVGLFGSQGAPNGNISGVGLLNVDIRASSDVAAGNPELDVGGLVGKASGVPVRGSYVTGTITTTTSGIAIASVGGLLGRTDGNTRIAASWSTAAVTVESTASNVTADTAGGLVGGTSGNGNIVIASYATGNVSADRDYARIGGLIGGGGIATVTACYAIGQPTKPAQNYNAFVGGLIAGHSNTALVTASYWNTDVVSGSPGGGTGKTTTELQAGTGTDFSGDFANWNNLTIDASGTNDDAPWELGGSSDYPKLTAWFRSYTDGRPEGPAGVPVARAGDDLTAYGGQPVRLNGSGSTAPAGATLTYEWHQSGGHSVMLSATDAAGRATFTAPETENEAGVTLLFDLFVTAVDRDGNSGATAVDQVAVLVLPAQPNELAHMKVLVGGRERTLTPGFTSGGHADVDEYRAWVTPYTGSAQIDLEAAEPGATISIDGDAPVLHKRTQDVNLEEGYNRFRITVTPPEPTPLPEDAPPPPTPDDEAEAEEPLGPVTYRLNIRRQQTPKLAFEPARLIMEQGASATYTVALDTLWLGAEVTVAISSDNPDVTVSPDSVSISQYNWSERTITVTAAEDADSEDDFATLTHIANGGHYDNVRGRVWVEVSDSDIPPTPTPTPTPGPTATPAPTPTPTPPPGPATAAEESTSEVPVGSHTVTITRKAGSLLGASVVLPTALAQDLEITYAPLPAGIPLASEGYGLGMTENAQAGVRMTVSGVPSGGLELCLPLPAGLVSEAGSRPLTLTRYEGASWQALPGAERRGMDVCAAGVSTGLFAAAYIIPAAPQLGPASGLTVTAGAEAGTLVLRWTAGTDATRHWVAGIKESDRAAGDFSGIIWTAADSDTMHTLTGLESGAEYVFAIAAGRGPAGSEEWSAWTPLARGTPQ